MICGIEKSTWSADLETSAILRCLFSQSAENIFTFFVDWAVSSSGKSISSYLINLSRSLISFIFSEEFKTIDTSNNYLCIEF